MLLTSLCFLEFVGWKVPPNQENLFLPHQNQPAEPHSVYRLIDPFQLKKYIAFLRYLFGSPVTFLVYKPPQKTFLDSRKVFIIDRYILSQVQRFFSKTHIRYLYVLHSFSKHGPVIAQTSWLGTKIVSRHCGKEHILSFDLWQENGGIFDTERSGNFENPVSPYHNCSLWQFQKKNLDYNLIWKLL